MLLSGLQVFKAHPTLYIGQQSGFAFDNAVLKMRTVNTPDGSRGRTSILGHEFDTTGPPIYGGRELWGFPKRYAQPSLGPEKDTLIGTLDYRPVRVATGTMGFKHKALDPKTVAARLATPNYLLKIVPHVDGRPRTITR